MKRRAPASPASDVRLPARPLTALALSCLERLLDDDSPTIQLAAARAILDRTGASGRGAGPAGTPGNSSTAAALQAEAELQRKEDG